MSSENSGTSSETMVLLGNTSNYMSLNHRNIIIWKISQKSKGLGRLMNSVYKESKPEGGTQLFGTAVQKAITDRVETMSALSQRLLPRQTTVVILRSIFEGARLVGTAVDQARMSDRTTKATRTLSSRTKVPNNIITLQTKIFQPNHH